MNKIIRSFLIAAAVSVAALPSVTMARQNPAVQPLFFEQLETATPAAQPAPISTSGAVTEVSWAGLAWELQNLKSSHVPLVIEFYSASQSDCVNWNPTGTDECAAQPAETAAAAAEYGGRVRFLRFNVQLHPAVLNGPDVRVLPSHLFIADYEDTQHYTAIKVWGLLNQSGFEQAIGETFRITP